MIFRCQASRTAPWEGCGPFHRWINAAGALIASLLLCLAALQASAQPGAPTPSPDPSPPAARPVTILVIGDSLTAGYGLSREDGFPAQLQSALADRRQVVLVQDGGVSGDTTTGGRARLAWMLGSSPEQQPDAVIVQLGANDALRGVDPDVTQANLTAILRELQARGLPVLLAGMRAPPNLGEDYRQRFDAIYPRLADAFNVPLYPFFLEGVAAVPSLNQGDGIHPNARGVAEIVRRITPRVEALAETAAARRTEQAGR
jgi:acyl-CoA thioesterase I